MGDVRVALVVDVVGRQHVQARGQRADAQPVAGVQHDRRSPLGAPGGCSRRSGSASAPCSPGRGGTASPTHSRAGRGPAGRGCAAGGRHWSCGRLVTATRTPCSLTPNQVPPATGSRPATARRAPSSAAAARRRGRRPPRGWRRPLPARPRPRERTSRSGTSEPPLFSRGSQNRAAPRAALNLLRHPVNRDHPLFVGGHDPGRHHGFCRRYALGPPAVLADSSNARPSHSRPRAAVCPLDWSGMLADSASGEHQPVHPAQGRPQVPAVHVTRYTK